MWFRVTYVSIDATKPTHSPLVPHGIETAEYREQTIEVALSSEKAFENDNIGRLKRQLPLEPLIDGVPTRVRSAIPTSWAGTYRVPLVTETLRKAIAWQSELDSGAVSRQVDIAQREGVTRARVTQVLMLLRLAPDIQESILSLAENPNPPRLGEHTLRPIARIEDPDEQVKAFEAVTQRHR